jgi:hypothetical protein
MFHDPDDMPEWLTRKKFIDGRLEGLGWKIVRYMPSFTPGTADKLAVAE